MAALRTALNSAGLISGTTGLAFVDGSMDPTAGAVLVFLAGASFVLVFVNQVGVFWDRFVKQKPPLLETVEKLKADFRDSLEAIADELTANASSDDARLEASLITLKTDLVERFQRIEADLAKAAGSRKGIHQQIDQLNARLCGVESTVDAVKGANSLQELAKVIARQ